jgi:hypothetical protein
MGKAATAALALVVGLVVGIPLGGRLAPPVEAPAAASPDTAFSAVPGAIGVQDVSGPYEVVEGWPQDLSTLPGHEQWTYGGARGIFAESPNRVFLLGGGELPKAARPQTRLFPDIGPNVQFPLAGLPWRNANTASPPGGGGSGQDPAKGMEIWRGASPPYRELGVDSRWEHAIVVVNAEGKIIDARGVHQSLRRGEAPVGGRRPHARDLQVHQRRRAARSDDRHAKCGKATAVWPSSRLKVPTSDLWR